MPGPHGSESSGPVKYRDLGVGGRERSVLVRGIVAPIFRCGKYIDGKAIPGYKKF